MPYGTKRPLLSSQKKKKKLAFIMKEPGEKNYSKQWNDPPRENPEKFT